MRSPPLLSGLVLAVMLALTMPRQAALADSHDPSTEPVAARSNAEAEVGAWPGWSYFYDGGVIPFVYGSALAKMALGTFTSPPETPRWFDSDEGGAILEEEAIPDYYVSLYAMASLGAVGAIGTDARWYHLKGMAQSILSTALLTESAKQFFGRHRPYYDPAISTDPTHRKSFFSGHASTTAAVATYTGIYLHQHLFARWRKKGQLMAWWEPIPLGTLAAVAVYVPYTRWNEKRHHLSDVLTGAAVGITTTVAFYAYQEHRYRCARRGRVGGESKNPTLLLPDITRPGVVLVMLF